MILQILTLSSTSPSVDWLIHRYPPAQYKKTDGAPGINEGAEKIMSHDTFICGSFFAERPDSKDSDRINRMDRINPSTNPVNHVHPIHSSFRAAPEFQNRFMILFPGLKNHREHRGHKEKQQTSVLSVSSVVDYPCSTPININNDLKKKKTLSTQQ